jgi:DNA adenine methylase
MALPCLVPRLGGKSKLKKLIVETYFPQDYESMIYVEPFVGGGSIFFHKNPSVLEVINDLDKNIYIVFKGAQTYTHLEVSNKLNKTYSKEDFNKIRDSEPIDEIDIFCKSFYLIKKSILGNCNCWKDDRAKMTVKLEGYKERLEDVIIYNTDYRELISKYDSPHTFFYLDPPYEDSEGIYKHHLINMFEMYSILSKIKGKFLLSYNNSELAREIFKDFNIYEVETKYLVGQGCVRKDNKITELLISNYDYV